jgi:large subunit ribosomal protein L9
MKVVLITDVAKLGRKGQIVEVSDGFAINSLFPSKKAVQVGSPQAKDILSKIQTAEKQKEAELRALEAVLSAQKDNVFEIKLRANEKGAFFKAFTIDDFKKHLEKASGTEFPDKYLYTDDLPIKDMGKNAGEYSIKINKIFNFSLKLVKQ